MSSCYVHDTQVSIFYWSWVFVLISIQFFLYSIYETVGQLMMNARYLHQHCCWLCLGPLTFPWLEFTRQSIHHPVSLKFNIDNSTTIS